MALVRGGAARLHDHCAGHKLAAIVPLNARRDHLHPREVTRESSTARSAVREYFKRYPKEQFLTDLETWRYLPSQTIEFVMKRLREQVEAGG